MSRSPSVSSHELPYCRYMEEEPTPFPGPSPSLAIRTVVTAHRLELVPRPPTWPVYSSFSTLDLRIIWAPSSPIIQSQSHIAHRTILSSSVFRSVERRRKGTPLTGAAVTGVRWSGEVEFGKRTPGGKVVARTYAEKAKPLVLVLVSRFSFSCPCVIRAARDGQCTSARSSSGGVRSASTSPLLRLSRVESSVRFVSVCVSSDPGTAPFSLDARSTSCHRLSLRTSLGLFRIA
ncbi:hypothetical protein BD414DRAFT_320008 [Trametes punicea]|nr:hypothetical protein BD414DRAFT_320008 [Trametes punicea]